MNDSYIHEVKPISIRRLRVCRVTTVMYNEEGVYYGDRWSVAMQEMVRVPQ